MFVFNIKKNTKQIAPSDGLTKESSIRPGGKSKEQLAVDRVLSRAAIDLLHNWSSVAATSANWWP